MSTPGPNNQDKQRIVDALAEEWTAIAELCAGLTDEQWHTATDCPGCGTPGFGLIDTEPGLPCRICGTPTTEPAAQVHGCCACTEIVRRPVVAAAAEPAHCPSCNP